MQLVRRGGVLPDRIRNGRVGIVDVLRELLVHHAVGVNHIGVVLFVTIVFTGVFGTHLNIVVAAVLVCLLVVKIVVRHEEIAPAVVIYVHVVVNNLHRSIT